MIKRHRFDLPLSGEIDLENQHEIRYRNGVLLETCNRLEFYAGSGRVERNTVRHLFRLTSGLESPLVGETAIQGQVKKAYVDACGKWSLSGNMHRLFQNALRVGKRTRSETGISRGAMSYGQAVLEIVNDHQYWTGEERVVIIGVSQVNRTFLDYLAKKQGGLVFLANRSVEKAREVADQYGARVVSFDQLPGILASADILVSATSAPHLILKKEQFPAGKNMLIFDLAVPYDIDPEIGERPGVKLLNTRQIERQINQNLRKRAAALKTADNIVEEEAEEFIARWGYV